MDTMGEKDNNKINKKHDILLFLSIYLYGLLRGALHSRRVVNVSLLLPTGARVRSNDICIYFDTVLLFAYQKTL